MADKKKILAIDDDPVFLRTLTSYLNPSFDLQISKSAAEATILLKDVKPDLILLDIEMPDISGFEFLHDIKKNPLLMKTPVIIVSGHTETEFVIHAEASGANGVVSKPVNREDLLHKISEVFEHPPKNLLNL